MDTHEARRILGIADSASASDVEAAYFARLASLRADGGETANASAIKELAVARNICFGRPPDAPPPTEPQPAAAAWGIEDFDAAPVTTSVPRAPAAKPKPPSAGTPSPSPRGRDASEKPAGKPPAKGPAPKTAAAPSPAASASAAQRPTPEPSPTKPAAPPTRSVMDSSKRKPQEEAPKPRSKGKRFVLAGVGAVALVVVALTVFSKGPVKMPGSLTSDVAALKKAGTPSRLAAKDAALDAQQAEAEAAEKDALAKADAGDAGAVAAMERARDLWRAVAVARLVAPAVAKAKKRKGEWAAIAKYVSGAPPKSAKEADEAVARGEKMSKGNNIRGAADAYIEAEKLYGDASSSAGRPALENLAKAVQKRAEEAPPLVKNALARVAEAEKELEDAKAAVEGATGSARAAAARGLVTARLALRSIAAEREAIGDEGAQATRVGDVRILLDVALRAGRESRASEMAEGIQKAQTTAEDHVARASLLVATVEAILHPPVVMGEGAGSYTARAGSATGFPPALAPMLSPTSDGTGGGVRLDLAPDRTFSMSGRVGIFFGYLAGTWSRAANGSIALTVWEEDDKSVEEPRPVATAVTIDAKAKTFGFVGADGKGAATGDAATGLGLDLRPLFRAVVLDLRDRWKATGLVKDAEPGAAAGGDPQHPAAGHEPSATAPDVRALTPEGARDLAKGALSQAGDGADLVKAQGSAMARIATADRAAADAVAPQRQASAKDLAALEAATKTFGDPDSTREACAAALHSIRQAEAGLSTALAAGGGPVAGTGAGTGAGTTALAGRYVMTMDAWPAPPRVKAALLGDDIVLDLRRDGVFTLATQWGATTHSWAGTWSPSAAEEGAASLVVLLDDRDLLATAIASPDWWVKVFAKKNTFAFRATRLGVKIPWSEKIEPLVPTTPRMLTLKTPVDGKVFDKGQPVVVSGTVVPTPHGTVTVNGTEAKVSKSNEFSVTVPAPEGEAPLRIEVTYGGEKLETVYATRTVEIDSVAPRLTISFPTQAEVTTDDAALTIRGEATDPHLDHVTVNDQVVDVRDEGGDRWSFLKTIPLAPGATATATIVAFDSLGHASAPSTYRLKRNAAAADVVADIGGATVGENPPMESPMLVLETPRTGSSVAGLAVAVAGRVKDAYEGDAVLVNGVPATINERAFSATVKLATAGWHVVVVEVRRGGAPVASERLVCRFLAGM